MIERKMISKVLERRGEIWDSDSGRKYRRKRIEEIDSNVIVGEAGQ